MWCGDQAIGFGLAGRVEGDDLRVLLEGRDPTTGTPLGNLLVDRTLADGKVVRAVAGFDATFSAPKSVSVWWALTGDPGLLEAHDLAVRTALDHLERLRSDDPGAGERSPPAPRHARVDGGDVPPDHVAGRRPAAAHPRRHLGQGADRRRSLVGVGCPLPEAPPADAGRPVPVGAARRADPPLRDRLGADRQRPGRDRRHAGRAARGVLQAGAAGRRGVGGEGRRVPPPPGPRPEPVGARRPDP